MTKREAQTQARREISQVYRTAANRHSTTWGLSVRTPRGTVQSDIGSYRAAVMARAEAVRERIAELTAE
jgi:hypothetical protein